MELPTKLAIAFLLFSFTFSSTSVSPVSKLARTWPPTTMSC